MRDDPTKYAFADGALKVTTVLGDIYTNGDPSGTRQLSCRRADHAGADYVLETKVDVTQLNGGYAQGGILVHADDDNYVKFDAISDVDNPQFNRIELRSEVAGRDPEPAAAGRPDPGRHATIVAAADQDRHVLHRRVLVRRRDLDGAAGGRSPTRMTNAEVRPLHARRADRRPVVGFEYFKVDGLHGLPAARSPRTTRRTSPR